jgi:3-oxoacid CoA-transferase subunit A/glutaconate CoA-transferase subunit A
MQVLKKGQGKLAGWRHPDEQRQWLRENKTRKLIDKQMSLKDAITKYVSDGDYIAMGGFGHVRAPMAAIYEIIRQKKKDLILACKTAVHDGDILIGSGCVAGVELAYAFAEELRGLCPASRRMVESGQCKGLAETTNSAFQWRFLAGMMGISCIPIRAMLGTDTFKYSSALTVTDPFTQEPMALIPSCNPDVVVIHVNRCDIYGNCQVDGVIVEDFELARSSRRVIITTEEIVPTDKIRETPWRTNIPYFVVDAVVEVPFGGHPGTMPYMYYFDEFHIGEWLTVSKTQEGTDAYFQKYVYDTKDFEEYIEVIGGFKKLNYLQKLEKMQVPLEAPWLKGRGR